MLLTVKWFFSALLLLGFHPPAIRAGASPLQDSLRLAALDCQALPSAASIRYLDLYNIPKESREKTYKVLCFVLNSLSRSRVIHLPRTIPDVNGPRLLCVDLDVYSIPHGAWDSLFELGTGRVPQPESYYNLPVFEVKEEYVDEEYEATETRYYNGYSREVLVKKTRKVPRPGQKEKIKKLTDAPWLSPADLQILRTRTHTKYPIGRADWFASYALYGKAYYRFLGIDPDKGKEADLEKLAKLDRLKALDFRAVTDTKIVTLNNRILVRYATVNHITGTYYWESLDTDKGIDDGDFILNLVRPKITAKEIIFGLANGLQGYGLSLANGNLVDVAAINIAADRRSKFQDPQVWTSRNCISCHNQGLWALEDKIRKFSKSSLLGILSKEKDKKEIDNTLEAYTYEPDLIIKHDQVLYEAAIRACNGWTPEANATAYEALCHSYLEQPLTLETFSLESGLDKVSLKKHLSSVQKIDHTLTGPLLIPPLNTYRSNWENRGFAALMLSLPP